MAEPPPTFIAHQPSSHSRDGGNSSTGGDSQPPGPTRPTYSKRGKITIVACVPCRRRKTKCDGKRPACSQCSSRDGQCHYDMNEEQRRLTFLRENVETLAEEKSSLEAVIWHLRNSTEDESFEILRRIRGGADPYSLVQQIQASRSLTQVKGDGPYPSTGSCQSKYLPPMAIGASREAYERLVQAIASGTSLETEDIVQRLRRSEPIDRIIEAIRPGASQSRSPNAMEFEHTGSEQQSLFYTRPMAANALVPSLGAAWIPGGSRAPDAHTPPEREDYKWTQVTEDREFIEHLLNTYFTWQHSFFQNFPEHLFRQDYEGGRTQYCSRVLVNAICAAGCLLSHRGEARGDPNDPSTAGAGFFEEGIRLLNQSDRSSIPTMAGVFILSHVEGYRARLGAMWGLVGRSARMALDLGVHLKNDKKPFEQMNSEEQDQEAARLHGFWGCFVSDQVTSLSLGRLPQFLTNSVTVELPPIDDSEDNKPWGPADSPVRQRPGARATTFRECATLSKIVNSTLIMFFAPSQIIRGRLLLDEYNKYLTWYRRLPSIVSSTENAPAHVLSLHMYYHAAVLLLFRPFLRAKFTESDLVPSELCRQAATAISDLFAKHLSLFDTTGIYTFQIQCLLTACTIHLINLPAIAATSALRAASDSFHGLVHRNTWAFGSIKLIKDLVNKWNIILPGEVEDSLMRSHPELPQAVRERFDEPAAPQAELVRGAKRAAFLNPSSHVLSKRQRLAPVYSPPDGTSSSTTNNPGPATGGSPSSSRDEVDGRRGGSSPFLFMPFHNQAVPLLGPIHTSASAEAEWSAEMSRVAQDFDGLRFEGDGWFDPFMGI